MLKKFKAFYNKENFNYSEGLVDPFEFHETFYRVLVMFKVADLENKQKVPWINQNTVITISGALAFAQVFTSFCHGTYNLDILDMTEAGTYSIIMFYLLLIQASTKLNVTQYHNLMRFMMQDFHYICTEGERYRKRYFDNQMLTWKICMFASVFTAFVGIGIVIFTSILLILYLATHKPGDGSTRPLMFPYWLPNVDFGATPYYEIAFTFANICSVLYAYNYIFMLQTQIVWIRHMTSKVDIIVWSIEDLLEDIHPATSEEEKERFAVLIRERFRKIVIHHYDLLRMMEDYTKVYKKMLMFEQKCCGPVVCLTAYCTLTKLEMDGEIQPILALLSFGTLVVHFIPSYCCTFLADKVGSICDACWSIPFWNAGIVIRPYMVLMMQRTLRPLPLQAPGFESISIETFSKKMASAYSMFNMLRQTDL